MTWWQGSPRRRPWLVAWALVMAVGWPSLVPEAQEASAATDAAATADAEEALAETSAAPEGVLSAEELQALVAPVALYPDLVLVLVLQASLAPLDIVQGQRFLDRYADDPSLTPDPDWDDSVIGLLNYPTVVQRMSDDLEGTDTLGTAVITQLEGVEDAILRFRSFMRAVGALESNDQMTVIAEGDVIRIEPTDENAVFIPEYDPDALLAALYSIDDPALADPEEPSELESEAIDTGTDEVVTETAEVPAAAPTYYPAVAPPPVTYSDPSPSWLGTAATFAGGAVVGGLVGWAIADDDDDHDNNGGNRYSRGDVTIEDSTIVVNRGDVGRNDGLDDRRRRAETERLKRDARETAQRKQAKRELEQRYADQPGEAQARGKGEGKIAGLSTSREAPTSAGSKQLAAKVEGAKAKADPSRREAAKARPTPTKGGKAARAGDRKEPQVASVFGGTKGAREVRRESDRGAKSRSRAKTEVAPNRSRDNGGVFAQRGGGGKGQADKQRGKKSRRGKK